MSAVSRQQWVVCFCEPGEGHPERQFAQAHDDSGRPTGPLWRDERERAVSDLYYLPGPAHIVVRMWVHVDIADENQPAVAL